MQTNLDLTKRQREVIERLEQGMTAKRIATDMGITRAAVYQHVERLKQRGVLPAEYTPSGQAPPGVPQPVEGLELGAAVPAPGFSGGLPGVRIAGSELSERRSAAASGGAEPDSAYARVIERAIATKDVAVLAYELGRLDAGGDHGLVSEMIEAALERLRVIRTGSRGEGDVHGAVAGARDSAAVEPRG